MRSVVLVLAVIAACGDNGSDLDVTIDTGTVHGAVVEGIRHFLGIPYAAPPVGDLRWRPPQPAIAWTGVLDTRDFGSQCPQSFSLSGAGGDEDCLFLNVYAPSGAHGLPVMVWVHGGAFIFGAGGEKYYAGDHLASAYGMVIVTINYRLGALGFLAHPALDTDDPAYPTSGNYGLEDQRAALEWVQRNIAAFGGDPKHVTIFGESAGGLSTCALYVSPRTHGLFGAAISESGLCSGNILEEPHAAALAAGVMAGAKLGCPGSDAAALACLRAKSSDDVLAMTDYPLPANQMPGGAFYNIGLLPAEPNVDGFVMPMSTADAFATGGFEPRPLLLGTNHDEGTLLQSTLFAAQIATDQDYHDALLRRFGEPATDAIIARYPTASFPSPNRAIAEVSGDAFFVCPARRTARGAASHGAPTFRYTFTHQVDNPFMSGLGVFHSSEIPFVFGEDVFLLDQVGTDGAPVATAMEDYWTSFAKTGTPKSASAPAWPAYDPTTDAYLDLGDPIAPGTQLKAELCDFWDTIQPLPSD